jgi:hypothetical protein
MPGDPNSHAVANAQNFAFTPGWFGRIGHIMLALLDVALVVTGGSALLFLLVGPIDAGLFSVSGFAKPFLQAFVLGSARAGIRRQSWLSDVLAAAFVNATRARQAVATRFPDWTPALTDAAVAIVTTRLAAKAVGIAANLAYPPLFPRSFTMPFESLKFAETFAAWDSAWYFDIAQGGYDFRPDAQSNIAFFPLYPLLMRAVAFPFGGTDRALWIGGIVISYVCFFVALVLLHRLTERMVGDREAARRTVLYIAVFPFSFPFARVYSESLFLCVSVAAIWCATLGRWSWAGMLGALAALTRPNGVLVAVPLGLMALQGAGSWGNLWRRTLPLLAVPGGLWAYCVYVYHLSGDPFAWLNAQAHWGYSIGNAPWAAVQSMMEGIELSGLYDYLLANDGSMYFLLHTVAGLAVVALTPSIFGRLGPALGCYVAIGILIPFSANSLEGIGRYSATLFPVFMYLGTTRSQRTHEALLVVGSLWLALNIGLFVTQRPVY